MSISAPNAPLPKVSIGLPCYNRPELLASAVASLRAQTCPLFELILSDNASPDPAMQASCRRLAEEDPRIRYVRQPVNRGPTENFFAVLDLATAPYFMWAADDDLWPDTFIERGLEALEAGDRFGAFFCQPTVIDSAGEPWRSLESFSRFASTDFRPLDLVRFLRDPELLGKANLLYGLFRREVLDSAMPAIRALDYDTWGADMAMVYAILCRTDWAVDDRIVLSKRHHTTDPPWEAPAPIHFLFTLDTAEGYCENYVRAAQGTPYEDLTRTVMQARWREREALEALRLTG